MQMINKAGNMIRLVCIPAFLTFMQKSFSTDQDSQNPSRLQDDPSLLWSSKPPVHGSTGLQRTGSDPCPRQHCPSHVLQPSLRFWTKRTKRTWMVRQQIPETNTGETPEVRCDKRKKRKKEGKERKREGKQKEKRNNKKREREKKDKR